MIRSRLSRTSTTQAALYRQRARARPATGRSSFRTLDIGSDKQLPYLAHAAEDNPAMGWRAMRMVLDRPIDAAPAAARAAPRRGGPALCTSCSR